MHRIVLFVCPPSVHFPFLCSGKFLWYWVHKWLCPCNPHSFGCLHSFYFRVLCWKHKPLFLSYPWMSKICVFFPQASSTHQHDACRFHPAQPRQRASRFFAQDNEQMERFRATMALHTDNAPPLTQVRWAHAPQGVHTFHSVPPSSLCTT